MLCPEKKLGRMVEIARMYYEQNMSQNEIAKALGISRPLVSVLLAEARENGIVTIKVNDLRTTNETLSQRIMDRFWLNSVTVVMDNGEQFLNVDDAVAAKAYDECFGKNNFGKSVGVGCGSMLGKMAEYAETLDEVKSGRGIIFPLIGGIQSVIRGYHTNELVRIFSLTTGKKAEFLYIPALFDTEDELISTKGTKPYQDMESEWDAMEQAIMSVSNFPSYPDLGVKSIYGDRLTKEHAVGRFLAYYFDINGNIIEPVTDTTLQASLEHLRMTDVTAVCSKRLKPQALEGALRLRIINRLIIPFELANNLMNSL